jgi:hypothetical protein
MLTGLCQEGHERMPHLEKNFRPRLQPRDAFAFFFALQLLLLGEMIEHQP